MLSIISILSIASIGLREPVYACPADYGRAMDRCIESSVGRYPSFPQVLLGHNNLDGTGVFRRLHELEAGDRFRYNRKVWTVYSKQIVHERSVSVLEVPEGELRLQTCVSDPRQRLIVYAK